MALFVFMLASAAWAAYGSGTAYSEGCGNGVCDSQENTFSCAKDCTPRGGYCGDRVCTAGSENTTNCPEDCGGIEICGDTACIGKEDSFSCPLDCDLPPDCGNKVCEEREHAYNCPIDCGYAESCGDSVCGAKENFYNCLADCKKSQNRCGDGTCDGRESSYTCAFDCGAPASCGNNVCDPPDESSYNCPLDCGEVASCGNSVCEGLENTYSCARDCLTVTPGNSFENAVPIKDGVFERKYTKNNLQDFFQLSLKGGERLIVSSTCKALYWGPNHRATPAVTIYDGKRDQLVKKSVPLKEKNDLKEILLTWATNGDQPEHLLYVEVAPESEWQREFTCTTKFETMSLLDLDGVGEAPAALEKAFEVKPGRYVENWLVGGEEGADERDAYLVRLHRGQKLEVKLAYSAGAELSMQFYDEQSRPLEVLPFNGRNELTATYVALESGPVYFTVSRAKSGRYDFTVALQEVDLCYYVKCEQGLSCVQGNCVPPRSDAPASQPVQQPFPSEFPTEGPAGPRQGIFESIVSFFLGLFGMK